MVKPSRRFSVLPAEHFPTARLSEQNLKLLQISLISFRRNIWFQLLLTKFKLDSNSRFYLSNAKSQSNFCGYVIVEIVVKMQSVGRRKFSFEKRIHNMKNINYKFFKKFETISSRVFSTQLRSPMGFRKCKVCKKKSYPGWIKTPSLCRLKHVPYLNSRCLIEIKFMELVETREKV